MGGLRATTRGSSRADVAAGRDMTSAATEGSAAWHERRQHNRDLALLYAKKKIAIFPSSGKTPLIPAWQNRDTEMTDDQREDAATRYRERHDGREPIHIGSTSSTAVIRKMWRAFPDAVPSISTGPSGLLVIDADQINDGPSLLRKAFDDHGGIASEVPLTNTQSGGLHLFFKNDRKLGSRAGAMKDLGCDVRGLGGQVVAPLAWREDGKRYQPDPAHVKFGQTWMQDAMPTTPDFIAELIGTASGDEAPALNDADPVVKGLIDELKSTSDDSFDALFDATVGRFPLDHVRECRPDFGFLFDHPGDDHSANRLKAATFLVGAYPDMTVQHYEAFCDEWEGSGDYDDRQLAREFAKAKLSPANVSKASDGSAFGAVIDEDDDQPKALKSKGSYAFEMESDVAASASLPDWLVEEVIEAETLCVIYGAPNVGKSLAVIDMLYHVAAGKPWRGRDVKQGSVLYISVEGPNGTARRAQAWRAHHGIANGENLPMSFIRGDVDLFQDKKSAQAVVDTISILEAATGLTCRAVAIDTVNAVTPGMDENSSADVGVFLRNLRTILAKTKAAVLPVHHTGKDESRGMRGSNALLAKAETTLLVTDGLITTMKMRDGQRGQKFPFTIKILDLWTNAKGKPVGAPVALEKDRGASLGPVSETDDDISAMTPADGPAEKLAATLRAFRDRVEAIAADTGEAVWGVGLSAKEVLTALSIDRKAAGLPELKDRTIVTRLLGRLVEAGEIVKTGDNRRTEYRLSGASVI